MVLGPGSGLGLAAHQLIHDPRTRRGATPLVRVSVRVKVRVRVRIMVRFIVMVRVRVKGSPPVA